MSTPNKQLSSIATQLEWKVNSNADGYIRSVIVNGKLKTFIASQDGSSLSVVIEDEKFLKELKAAIEGYENHIKEYQLKNARNPQPQAVLDKE